MGDVRPIREPIFGQHDVVRIAWGGDDVEIGVQQEQLLVQTLPNPNARGIPLTPQQIGHE